jgi:hypothetical protein
MFGQIGHEKKVLNLRLGSLRVPICASRKFAKIPAEKNLAKNPHSPNVI